MHLCISMFSGPFLVHFTKYEGKNKSVEGKRMYEGCALNVFRDIKWSSWLYSSGLLLCTLCLTRFGSLVPAFLINGFMQLLFIFLGKQFAERNLQGQRPGKHIMAKKLRCNFRNSHGIEPASVLRWQHLFLIIRLQSTRSVSNISNAITLQFLYCSLPNHTN